MYGDLIATLYNHVLTPDHNSCLNNTLIQEGAWTASSKHPGGVNVMFADGHVSAVGRSVDVKIWRALGSRNQGEIVDEKF